MEPRPIKVCHFTSAHRAEDTRIFVKMCRSLARNGYHVSLVAPNAQMELRDGVAIIGVPFTGGRFKRIWSGSKSIAKSALSLNADIYHFHDPELLRHVSMFLKHGKKVIYDVHEDLPSQILTKPYLPGFLRRFVSYMIEKYEDRVSRKLSGIITATPYIRKRFEKLNPNSIDVCNYPSLDELGTPATFNSKKKEACFISGLTEERGIRELIHALDGASFRLNLGGKFSPPELKEELIQLPGWKQVNDLGFLDRKGIIEVLNASSVGLVTMRPSPNLVNALPVKMFEYMAAGIPFVATDTPMWRSIAEKCNCGVCVDSMNPADIRIAVQSLLDDPERAETMGRNGRAAVEKEFNWEIEEKKLLKIYSNLRAH